MTAFKCLKRAMIACCPFHLSKNNWLLDYLFSPFNLFDSAGLKSADAILMLEKIRTVVILKHLLWNCHFAGLWAAGWELGGRSASVRREYSRQAGRGINLWDRHGSRLIAAMAKPKPIPQVFIFPPSQGKPVNSLGTWQNPGVGEHYSPGDLVICRLCRHNTRGRKHPCSCYL